jgi:hypothetical protein
MVTVILSSITISITVNGTEGTYHSPVAFNIMFGAGLVMLVASVILGIRMKCLASRMVSLTAKDIA